jgi:hypothetical protein
VKAFGLAYLSRYDDVRRTLAAVAYRPLHQSELEQDAKRLDSLFAEFTKGFFAAFEAGDDGAMESIIRSVMTASEARRAGLFGAGGLALLPFALDARSGDRMFRDTWFLFTQNAERFAPSFPRFRALARRVSAGEPWPEIIAALGI